MGGDKMSLESLVKMVYKLFPEGYKEKEDTRQYKSTILNIILVNTILLQYKLEIRQNYIKKLPGY